MNFRNIQSRTCIAIALWVIAAAPASVWGQAWLSDQSLRNSTPPDVAGLPTVPPSLGYTEPPPPLAPEGSLSVFAPDVPTIEMPSKPTAGIDWYNPWTWIPKDHWTNSAELGINGSSGNAESFSIQTGTRFKRKSDFTLFDLRLTHNRTSANGVETQNNTLLYTDFERNLGESKWSYFVKNGLEWDAFKAFDLRFFVNSGLSYNIYNTKDLKLSGRFGSGTSREFGGPDNRWVPEALFGFDYEHQVNSRNKLIARLDYFPDWTNFADYRMVSDVSWEYLLDEKGNLSVKLGALDRYDSTPNGRKPNDVNYSALLLYKF
jgi:putative salt-induced outer membrane protein YdiY